MGAIGLGDLFDRDERPARMTRALRDRDGRRGWPLKVRRIATVDLALRRFCQPREEHER